MNNLARIIEFLEDESIVDFYTDEDFGSWFVKNSSDILELLKELQTRRKDEKQIITE